MATAVTATATAMTATATGEDRHGNRK